MAPAWVRPFVLGVAVTAAAIGAFVLVTRPRHDTIEVLIATPVPQTIAVAISGEVVHPGVYQVPGGSRVADLLALAGGAAERADPAVPSRALLLRDEMHVHIPAASPSVASTMQPAPAGGLPAPTSASPPPAAPTADTGAGLAGVASVAVLPVAATPIGTAPPPPSPVTAPSPVAAATQSLSNAQNPAAAPATRSERTPTPSGPINLNTATAAELERLPGIGPALAARIVEDRQRNGPFRRIDDLDRVSGIGPTLLARLRPLVSV